MTEDTGHVHRYVDMTLPSLQRWAIGVAFAVISRGAPAQTLANSYLRAEFDAQGLRALIDRTDGRRYGLEADGFSVTIDNETLIGRTLTPPTRQVEPQRVSYRYSAGPVALTVRYELRPDWRFLSKQIEVRVARTPGFRVREVELIRETFDDTPTTFYEPPSARANLQTGVYGSAVRFDSSHSLLVVIQNPFLAARRSERALALRYAPDMDWKTSYGAFVSDRALIAPRQQFPSQRRRRCAPRQAHSARRPPPLSAQR